MKQILVVCVGIPTGESITAELNTIFRGVAQAEFCLCHQLRERAEGRDIVLFSSRYCQALCPDVTFSAVALPARRVINYRNLQEVIELEAGSRVLLVNNDKDSTTEALEQLMEIGLTDLSYVPCYPGSPSYPEIDVAITLGERSFVPGHVTRVIDIGVRALDIRTIYDLARLLGAAHLLDQSMVARYLSQIVTVSKSLSQSRRQTEQTERLLAGIFDQVDSGIAYVGADLRLVRVNLLFESILGRNRELLLGRRLEELLGDRFCRVEEGSFVVPVRNRTVLLRIKTLDEMESYLITADYADTIQKLDRRIRQDSAPHQRRRLYTFQDYLTWDENCKKMLALAEKFTRTGGTVLIQGESGTGKEILAQSIHSGSPRRKAPFLPVNITSLTPTLAESELFGYEDASFTGAKKGGKAGIFELADGGTVFIDEIGDASPELQAKLLRALEEKSIRRVGGAEEIPIRASVVAATNRDLPAMIREGKFREDLFFRLSMFPLTTIPLRERPGDILPLLRHFLDLDTELTETLLGPEIKRFLQSYRWPGNVRELMNVAEYIKLTHEGRPLTLRDLPAYMSAEKTDGGRVFLSRSEYLVLNAVSGCGPRGAGRNRLQGMLSESGADLGIGKIRAILRSLEDRGLIAQERSGCAVTDRGISALKQFQGP